jgi:1-acyl-sn-glycerol-3-phosphate acyltransferase
MFLVQCIRFTSIFFVLTPFLFGVRFLLWPTALVSERADRALKRWVMLCWYRGVLFCLGMRVEVQGTPPKQPFFLVANHLSYMDMVVLAYETGCIYVSKGDIEHWPVIGFMVKSMYIIFIDRQNKRDTLRVNGLIEHALDYGDGIGVFPESRISRGLDVEPFKSALIQPAVANEIPIHYATLGYRSPEGAPPANKIVGWWRPEPFFSHIFRLGRYPGVVATVHFGDTPLEGGDRKALANTLWEAVRENFTPVE